MSDTKRSLTLLKATLATLPFFLAACQTQRAANVASRSDTIPQVCGTAGVARIAADCDGQVCSKGGCCHKGFHCCQNGTACCPDTQWSPTRPADTAGQLLSARQ
jgi:hypothetical protein